MAHITPSYSSLFRVDFGSYKCLTVVNNLWWKGHLALPKTELLDITSLHYLFYFIDHCLLSDSSQKLRMPQLQAGIFCLSNKPSLLDMFYSYTLGYCCLCIYAQLCSKHACLIFNKYVQHIFARTFM